MNDESSAALLEAEELVEKSLLERNNVIIGGDFNMLRTNNKMKKLQQLLPFILENDIPARRARGIARKIDFLMSNLRIHRQKSVRPLSGISDH